jgi:hypothetical protein
MVSFAGISYAREGFMKLPVSNVMMSTNGHGFGIRKADGAMVFFEFETAGAAKAAREQIEEVVSAALDITINGG